MENLIQTVQPVVLIWREN